MKTNICRPIIFYNNFLPANSENCDWKYYAFGTFDGVSVDEMIPSENTDEVLLKIWDHQKAFSRKLKGKFAAQVVYALCYADKKQEEKFWQNDDYPFTFFCRLQFKKNLNVFRKNKDKFEEKLKSISGTSTMLYMTYDNSDLMLVVKSQEYKNGAGLVNALHKGINFSFDEEKICELKNSFTVFAIKQEFINKVIDEAVCEKLNKTMVTSVSIRIIERKCGEIKKLQDCIDNQINNKGKYEKSEIIPILGADDEIICLKNIGWGDFLRLYCENTGAFHNTSPIYQQYIAAATTTISTKVEEYQNLFSDCRINTVIDDAPASSKTGRNMYMWYVSELRKKVNVLEKNALKENALDSGSYKELYMILNALPKFSEEIFSDYIFFAMLKPIDTLLDLLEKGMNDSYYAFIKCFSMYIQNSVKSDRHSMQVMDFNTKIYDIPVKLNAFYTAYIYKVCDILNISDSDETHEYDFMVVPGVTDFVNVVELFQQVSPQKRLLRAEIPENRFYDARNIMIIFAHEAAHYVGTALRNRKERYDYVLESISSIYVDYIRSYWNKIAEGRSVPPDVKWTMSKVRMTQLLKCMIDREQEEEYLKKRQLGKGERSNIQIKKLIENNIRYREYFRFLGQNLYRAMMDISLAAIPNVFGGITYDLNEEEQQRIFDGIKEVSAFFLSRYGEKTSVITVDTILEILNSLYEESFADLISIMLLKLDVRDYLNSLIKEHEQQKGDIDKFFRTETVYRITLVVNVMCHEEAEMENRLNFYENDEYLEKRSKLISAIRKLSISIEKGWMENFEMDEYRSCCIYAFIDKNLYNKIFQYLLKCRKDLKQYIENVPEKSEMCRELRDFYHKYVGNKESNVEQQVAEMERFVSEYKRKLFSELEMMNDNIKNE